ncbi:nitroreductase family protein [Lichenibacterium dinghuense]|uniref:nitroreductase family protein n=1 Tax=Lichenibacterium dinghuense TaxID=2895977 RepID=UPI001F255771|nr:nitroreductase family protein [Lichenibacterium sp. 6Y81]
MTDTTNVSDKRTELYNNYDYDFMRFAEHSSAVEPNLDSTAVGAELVSAAHAVEKGLAMADTRAGFAAPKIRLMMDRIADLEHAGATGFATRSARGVLRAYVAFHDEHSFPLPGEVEARLREFASEDVEKELPGGSIEITRAEVLAATAIDYDAFLRTRRSVRQFTGEAVSEEEVRRAVSRAIRSPRTRNRETRHVFVAYSQAMRDHLLTLHRGNLGFGHKLGAVLVVTVDLRQFDMAGERNQCWIDGGMFAVSLVFAFHAQGLGTCMLNWSAALEQDQALRREFDIPDYHVVVTLIGVGQIPERLTVASSPSPGVEDVLRNLEVRA